MKIYLCHNYSAKVFLNQHIRPTLEMMGHKITSRWLDEDHSKRDDWSQRRYAEIDLEDIFNADALLHFADPFQVDPVEVGSDFMVKPHRPGRGKFIELGAAHCMNKIIYVVGLHCEESVFYFLKGIERYRFIEDLYVRLAKQQTATA